MTTEQQAEYNKLTVSELEHLVEQSSNPNEISELLDVLIFRRKKQLLQLTDGQVAVMNPAQELKGFISKLFGGNRN